MTSRRRAALAAILILLSSPLQGQGIPPAQLPAVNAMVAFIRRMEGDARADAVRRGFESGSIRIAPVPDNDNADTNTDTGVITLNPGLIQQIHRADGKQNFKAVADWVATLKHEEVHAQQSTPFVIGSNIRRVLGAGCPHEVAGWRAGFQSYYDWIQALRGQMGTGSQADREATAAKLRELIKGFNEYRQNYPAAYGDLRITGRDGVPMDLAEAAQEVQGIAKVVDTALDDADFVVTTIPMVQSPKKGETFTVSANPRGGAFDTRAATNRESLYTYAWYADGAALGQTGRAIARKATRSEVLTVMVTDRHGRKRSGSCKVTVQEEPPPPVPPPTKAAPAKAPAKPAPPPAGTSGRKLHAPPDAMFDNNPAPAASKKALESQLNALRARHRELKAQLDRSGGHDAATSREMTEVYREYMALKKRYDAMK
jgi:hypothetical protein